MPLIEEKYGDNLDHLGNEIVQKLFRDLVWREKLTVEAMTEWNDSKLTIVRPFLREYGISNVDSIYSEQMYEFMRLKNSSFIDTERLRVQYGTEKLNQILYDGKYTSGWVQRCPENLKSADENLLIGLDAVNNEDLVTLNNIQPIDPYYDQKRVSTET